jgi:hypothetical protein
VSDTEGKDFQVSPTQAIQLISLSVMLNEGDIFFRAHDADHSIAARRLITDVAQELALQIGNEESQP